MLNIDFTNKFKKELELMLKRGKDKQKIITVINCLVNQIPLEPKHKDHALIGNFKNRRDCHIEPDWLLIYRLEDDAIIFERTGTHSDIFK